MDVADFVEERAIDAADPHAIGVDAVELVTARIGQPENLAPRIRGVGVLGDQAEAKQRGAFLDDQLVRLAERACELGRRRFAGIAKRAEKRAGADASVPRSAGLALR